MFTMGEKYPKAKTNCLHGTMNWKVIKTEREHKKPLNVQWKFSMQRLAHPKIINWAY